MAISYHISVVKWTILEQVAYIFMLTKFKYIHFLSNAKTILVSTIKY